MNKLLNSFLSGMREFGHNIVTIVNTMCLLIVYLLCVGPVSIVARIKKKKFLDINTNRGRETYWSELNLSKKPMEEYFRQF